MFKTTIAAAAAAVAFAPAAALARSICQCRATLVGLETTTLVLPQISIWYEGEVGAASYYVQGTCHRRY